MSVRVAAHGYVDASGDASLSYEAGLEVREPDAAVYGSLNFLIEGYDTDAVKDLVITEVHDRLAERGDLYGLVRHDGFLMHFPGKNIMLANVTHFETPLDPLGTRADGVRGTTAGGQRHPVPAGRVPADLSERAGPRLRQPRPAADALDRRPQPVDARRDPRRRTPRRCRRQRCAWWVELHNAPDLVHWEKFAPGPRLLHPAQLHGPARTPTTSSPPAAASTRTCRRSRPIRVMGPCIAMGAAAAHALDLAGTGAVHAIDLAALQQRLADNLDRND